MRPAKFGPRYGFKKFDEGGPTMTPEEKSRQKQAQREADAARRQREADMDRNMKAAWDRFQRSKENDTPGHRKGGKVKKYAKGGSVSSASKRADGCAVKGKTRGKFV